VKLKGQRVTVMGLGLFGGGVGAVRFLVREGAVVTVTDLRPEKDLCASVRALNGLPIAFVLEGHEETDFRNTDLIVANPAVPRSSPYLKIAESAGVPITSEICLFVERCPAPIIGITGSSGKTTTTSLIGEMLKQKDKRTRIGGNIGGSLLDELDTLHADVPIVLELSSFQLDRLGDLPWSPQIAVATNFAPNHIDVHGSLQAYRKAKRQIVMHQTKSDWTIVNGEDAEVSRWAGAGQRIAFAIEGEGDVFVRGGKIQHTIGGETRTICSADTIALRGRHNLANALAATGAAIISGVSEKKIADVLQTFQGVPHRLEQVAEVNGILYVNDSIATSPDRTRTALMAFDRPIVLIAGGYDKGIAFDDMEVAIEERVAHLIVMGETGDAIAATAKGKTNIHRVENLEEAMDCATDLAQFGDVVLLSPASASYDQFRNFEERGQRFRECVKKLRD
jgi:UDP-N-acetylmuramoylalanine--D-glutamate ligase